jgi:hypothetical protein
MFSCYQSLVRLRNKKIQLILFYIFQTFNNFNVIFVKLESTNFRIMSMSSIEVSLLASNYKMESDTERSTRRPQRPPPPPPSQSQLSSPPIEQKNVPPDRMISLYFFALRQFIILVETSPLSTETSNEPIEDTEKNVPSLL